MRDRRQVAHFCRFCVNLVMLIFLYTMLTLSTNTVVEFHLTEHVTSKLSPGLVELSNKDELYELY